MSEAHKQLTGLDVIAERNPLSAGTRPHHTLSQDNAFTSGANGAAVRLPLSAFQPRNSVSFQAQNAHCANLKGRKCAKNRRSRAVSISSAENNIPPPPRKIKAKVAAPQQPL